MKDTDLVAVDVVITKAGGIADNAPADLLVEFSGEPPDWGCLRGKELYEKAGTFYNEQAATLGKALINTLPGGTIDRLIVFFLTQKASYFQVPYVKPHEEASMSDLIEATQPFVAIANSTDDLEEHYKIGGISVSAVRKLRDAVNKFLK